MVGNEALCADMKMAGATGLEPAASGVTGRRYNQLNYAPAWKDSQYKDATLFCLQKKRVVSAFYESHKDTPFFLHPKGTVPNSNK